MENNLLDSKKVKFGVSEAALASLLFVIYNFLFIEIYSFLPNGMKTGIVSYVASFLLEFTFALAAITVACAKKTNLVKASGMNKKISVKMVFLGFLISIVSLIGFGNVTNLFLELLYSLGYSSVLSDVVIDSFWKYLGYVIVSCITPAVCEELLFRGTILSGLKQYGPKIAIIISTVIFTIMHGNAEQTVHQFIIGIIVGYIFYKTGNLWLGVIVHFFNNFISVTGSYIISLMPSSGTEEVASTAMSGLEILYNLLYVAVMAYLGYYFVKLLLKKLFDEDERVNGKNQENLNLQTITIDGEESVVEMAIDGETSVATSETSDEGFKQKQSKEPLSTGSVIMFALSGVYLVFEWVATLLIGFGLF